MSVAIIDYGSGNLRSAEKAVERALRDHGLNQPVIVTSCPDEVARVDRIILPGVGAFGDCIQGLRALDGMAECLEQAVIKQGKPFLGICVGMQLLATIGHEHGVHKGLDWIAGKVKKMTVPDGQDLKIPHMGQDLKIPHMGQNLKIPHMGWNQIDIAGAYQTHPIFSDMKSGDHAYFVHSYKFEADDPAHVMATADYGGALPAIIGRDNIIGTQFHPEKSQQVGLQLMENFLSWRP